MGDVSHFVRVFCDNPREIKFYFSPLMRLSSEFSKHSNGNPIDDNQLISLIDAADEHGITQRLYLENNQVSTLPSLIGNLTALTQLDLDNNQLSSLPDSFGNLTALKELAVS